MTDNLIYTNSIPGKGMGSCAKMVPALRAEDGMSKVRQSFGIDNHSKTGLVFGVYLRMQFGLNLGPAKSFEVPQIYRSID